MGRLRKLLERVRRNPFDVRFDDLVRLVEAAGYVERKRGGGTSHKIFRHPDRPELPLINLQASRGRAKGYQVRQVLDVMDEFGLGPP